MIDKNLVESKMNDLKGYYGELSDIFVVSAREIIEDNLKLRSVERLFQLIVDTSLDINTHIIASSNFNVPDDYQSTFISLGEHKVLPMEFASKIAPSVGLRNLVVHKYGHVDVKKMVDDIKNEIEQYIEYLQHINKYITD